MNGPGEVAGLALIKLYGIKAVLGMIGGAMLYIVLPPVKPDGSFDRREFVARLAIAGLFSSLFGDWAVALLTEHFPRLHAIEHPGPVYLMVGAPGWWVSRAVALWFQKRDGLDASELIKEIKP